LGGSILIVDDEVKMGKALRHVLVKEGHTVDATDRPEEALAFHKECVRNHPDEFWPMLQLADVQENLFHDVRGAIHSVCAVFDDDPENWEALEALRRLLRVAGRWQDLARHLEVMIGATLDATKLNELHRELSDILVTQLSAPSEAVAVLKRAEWYGDPEGAAAWYWREIRKEPDNLDLLEEAGQFFKVNQLNDHLAELLHLKVRKVPRIEDLVQVFDELTVVYVTRMREPPWERLVNELEAAIERCPDDGVIAVLEARRRLVRDVYAEHSYDFIPQVPTTHRARRRRNILLVVAVVVIVAAAAAAGVVVLSG